MNLLLLDPSDLGAGGTATVRADRYPPRAGLWPPLPGRVLRVGMRDGQIGRGEVDAVGGGLVQLRVAFTDPPPPPLPMTLLLALPRPKMLRRVLRASAELGIKRVVLLNASRVDKSYWQSPLLAPASVEGCFRAGLEQAVDTGWPELQLRSRLRPFVEDELPALAAGSERVLAHPAAALPVEPAGGARVTLAIGPEGGFTDFEAGLFAAAGFTARSLGPRVLRVETALPVLATAICAARTPLPQ